MTNTSGLPINNVDVIYRVPAGISFAASAVAPALALNCSASNCGATEEARWNFASIAANGGTETITINAQAAATLTAGDLVRAPIQATANELDATVTILHSTPVQ